MSNHSIGSSRGAQIVSAWTPESVVAWLTVHQLNDISQLFFEAGVSGSQLLDLDTSALVDIGLTESRASEVMKAITTLRKEVGLPTTTTTTTSSVPSSIGSPSSSPPPPPSLLSATTSSTPSSHTINDPLKDLANSKSAPSMIADAVTSGLLWRLERVGMGSAMSWISRFVILGRDSSLNVFQTAADASAMLTLFMPSYTVTVCTRADNSTNRPFAFKVINKAGQQHVFAANSDGDARTWMNTLGLASISFATDTATTTSNTSGDGDSGGGGGVAVVSQSLRLGLPTAGVTVASALASPSAAPTKKLGLLRRMLSKSLIKCTIHMPDGVLLNLFAKNDTFASELVLQACELARTYETIYFGLFFFSSESEKMFLIPSERVLKQLPIRKDDTADLYFGVRCYPVYNSEILLPSTLHTYFLCSQNLLLQGELPISSSAALLFAGLAAQALYGDYVPGSRIAEELPSLVPERNKREMITSGVSHAVDLGLYLSSKVVQAWVPLKGVPKHVAQLKYLENIGQHPLFGMQYFETKNLAGEMIVLGVAPKGLLFFYGADMSTPRAMIGWRDCMELCCEGKKFKVVFHPHLNKSPFELLFARSSQCEHAFDICLSTNELFNCVLTAWQGDHITLEIAAMRERALVAARTEWTKLKQQYQVSSNANNNSNNNSNSSNSNNSLTNSSSISGSSDNLSDAEFVRKNTQALMNAIEINDFIQFQDQLLALEASGDTPVSPPAELSQQPSTVAVTTTTTTTTTTSPPPPTNASTTSSSTAADNSNDNTHHHRGNEQVLIRTMSWGDDEEMVANHDNRLFARTSRRRFKRDSVVPASRLGLTQEEGAMGFDEETEEGISALHKTTQPSTSQPTTTFVAASLKPSLLSPPSTTTPSATPSATLASAPATSPYSPPTTPTTATTVSSLGSPLPSAFGIAVSILVSPSNRIASLSRTDSHSSVSDSDVQAEAKVLGPAETSYLPHGNCSGRPSPTPISEKTAACGRWQMIRKNLRLFLRKQYPWVQLAGHDGGFVADVDPAWILKRANDFEKVALPKLKGDPLYPFVPVCNGMLQHEGNEFVQLENLLLKFNNPSVMDCKIGSRTFLEEDVESTELRMDLLKKMISLDPNAPSPTELKSGITKLRYMQFREALSSSLELGFRIEAMRVDGVSDKNLKMVHSREQVIDRIRQFFGSDPEVKRQYLERMEAIRAALDISPFFASHEMVGSSLLFVHDSSGKVGLSVIDFGKTIPRDHPLHNVEWNSKLLNHADGYMLGFDSLFSVLRDS